MRAPVWSSPSPTWRAGVDYKPRWRHMKRNQMTLGLRGGGSNDESSNRLEHQSMCFGHGERARRTELSPWSIKTGHRSMESISLAMRQLRRLRKLPRLSRKLKPSTSGIPSSAVAGTRSLKEWGLREYWRTVNTVSTSSKPDRLDGRDTVHREPNYFKVQLRTDEKSLVSAAIDDLLAKPTKQTRLEISSKRVEASTLDPVAKPFVSKRPVVLYGLPTPPNRSGTVPISMSGSISTPPSMPSRSRHLGSGRSQSSRVTHNSCVSSSTKSTSTSNVAFADASASLEYTAA
jgi:hypothetical protein